MTTTTPATAPVPLEARCAWRTRRGRRQLRLPPHRRPRGRARRRARPRREPAPTTSSTSPATRSRCPRSGPSWPASPTTSSTAAAWCSSGACRSSATARTGRRRSTGASGTHLGHPWPQNAKGHLLGDVTDQGRAIDDPTARGNEIGGIAAAVPLRRLRPRRAVLPRRRRRRRRQPRGQRRHASTTTWCATSPSSPRSCTSRSPTTCGASRPRARKPWYTMPVFTRRRRPAVRPLHPALHRVVAGATPTSRARRTPPAPRWTGSTPCAPTPSTRWRWACRPATCSS